MLRRKEKERRSREKERNFNIAVHLITFIRCSWVVGRERIS
jgi:hypothetical protein